MYTRIYLNKVVTTYLLVHENGKPGRAPVKQDSAYNLVERSMFLCHSYDECMQKLTDNRGSRKVALLHSNLGSFVLIAYMH